MIQINSVEIYYFRSIYHLKIKTLKDLNVISGKNDCGKSNLLKALNLFFNNQTDWQQRFDFQKDFSKKRLTEVRKETIKGKQFIQVKIEFIRGAKSEKSLPEKFTITKTWHRDSSTPETKTSIERQFKNNEIKVSSLHRAVAQLQIYLNKIKFEYVPAIKDKDFSNYALGILQDTILDNSQNPKIRTAVQNLNDTVEEGAQELNKEFKEISGIETDIKLPEDLTSLFRAFSVDTKLDDESIDLAKRGDGVQTRFIPSLLHHIAKNSKVTYIWGFEEPENCLEHALSTELANKLKSEYAFSSQIITTTHSAAFIALEGENTTKFRAYKKDHATEITQIYPNKDGETLESETLAAELGLLQLASQQQQEYEKMKAELEAKISNLQNLEEKYKEDSLPIILTEGRTDPTILLEAWRRLKTGAKPPFRIMSCSTVMETDGEAAGAGMLKSAITCVRPDHPLTIAIFDSDDEGIKEFEKLHKTFSDNPKHPSVKTHKNKRAHAFTLPCLPEKSPYKINNNLCIEFLFPENCITKQTSEGHGLELQQKIKSENIGGKVISTSKTTEPHFRDIRGGKTIFSSKIVQTFKDSDFEGFRPTFDLIEALIQLHDHSSKPPTQPKH
jgi:AAA15 family ATPase/GTPase